MSAFVVNPAHIDVVLSTAINGPSDARLSYGLTWHPPYVDELLEGSAKGPLSAETAGPAGQALLAECVASVSHRYDESLGNLPGPLPNPDPEQYKWTDFGRYSRRSSAARRSTATSTSPVSIPAGSTPAPGCSASACAAR